MNPFKTLISLVKILLVPSWINFGTWVFIYTFLEVAYLQAKIHLAGKSGIDNILEDLMDKKTVAIVVIPLLIICTYFLSSVIASKNQLKLPQIWKIVCMNAFYQILATHLSLFVTCYHMSPMMKGNPWEKIWSNENFYLTSFTSLVATSLLYALSLGVFMSRTILKRTLIKLHYEQNPEQNMSGQQTTVNFNTPESLQNTRQVAFVIMDMLLITSAALRGIIAPYDLVWTNYLNLANVILALFVYVVAEPLASFIWIMCRNKQQAHVKPHSS